MEQPFTIEHSVERYKDGRVTITLYKVFLNRRKTKKTYVIQRYETLGVIKVDKDKYIQYTVKDLFALRWLNYVYLKSETVRVEPELITALCMQFDYSE